MKLFEKVYRSENEYLDKIKNTNLKSEGITSMADGTNASDILQHDFRIKKIIDDRLSSMFAYNLILFDSKIKTSANNDIHSYRFFFIL